MIELGIALSSEEHGPSELVRQAVLAEQAGVRFAAIWDHYHPWTDRQGESPFVWSVLGAIATSTQRLELTTMVTCPTVRMHPAVIAQAAATIGLMMPGRFTLGLGSGENLNEHIVGRRWPRAGERIDMLEEAVDIIRRLWTGETVSADGCYFTVDTARIYSLPEKRPSIFLAAAGPKAARLAGRAGDGLITTSPDAALVQAFEAQGNTGPRLSSMAVSIHATEQEGMRLAAEIWPTSAVEGSFKQELPRPKHFEESTAGVTPQDVAQSIVCSLDPAKHVEMLSRYAAAGFQRVYVRQTGGDQERFMQFYAREVVPALQRDLSGAIPG